MSVNDCIITITKWQITRILIDKRTSCRTKNYVLYSYSSCRDGLMTSSTLEVTYQHSLHKIHWETNKRLDDHWSKLICRKLWQRM